MTFRSTLVLQSKRRYEDAELESRDVIWESWMKPDPRELIDPGEIKTVAVMDTEPHWKEALLIVVAVVAGFVGAAAVTEVLL